MTLMAELDSEPDETLAASLAWSEDDSLDDPPVGSWRSVLLRAAAVLVFCVLTAVGVVVVWREWPKAPPAAAPAVPTSSVDPGFKTAEVTSPAPASVRLPPVGDAAQMKPPDPDTKFLAAMDRAEVHMPTTADAINQGHRICGALDKGTSIQAVTEKLLSLSPGVTYEQIRQVVNAAINSYCPQHDN